MKQYMERHQDLLGVMTAKAKKNEIEESIRQSLSAEEDQRKGVRKDGAPRKLKAREAEDTRERMAKKQRRRGLSGTKVGRWSREQGNAEQKKRREARWWQFPSPGPPKRGCDKKEGL